MKVNISQIRTYMECPTKAHYLHHLKRQGKAHAVALELGTIWHAAVETRLHGADVAAAEVAIAQHLSVVPKDVRDEVDKGWTAILPAFREWQVPKDWKIISVERVLEQPLPRMLGTHHILQGRLDAVVFWNGFYWHLQHKTVGRSVPLPLYFVSIERDWHECGYQYLAEKAGHLPYGGTILNTVRKLSAKAIQEDPKRALALQYIPRNAAQVDKAIHDINTICNKMQAEWATPADIIQNRSSCLGRYGNSPCPYLGVCNGEVSLYDDSIFEDAPDRYAIEAEV